MTPNTLTTKLHTCPRWASDCSPNSDPDGAPFIHSRAVELPEVPGVQLMLWHSHDSDPVVFLDNVPDDGLRAPSDPLSVDQARALGAALLALADLATGHTEGRRR